MLVCRAPKDMIRASGVEWQPASHARRKYSANIRIPNPHSIAAPTPGLAPTRQPAISPPAVLTVNRPMMISDKQLEANRRNAHLSTGPKTEEGKRRASLNALRHGLTGQVTAMTDADRVAHDQFSQALIQSLAPEGAMEIQLA